VVYTFGVAHAGFVRQKRCKKVPSFIKQKVASFSAFFSNEPSIGEDVGTKYGLDVV
jgi:hypothetical protein